MNEDERALHEFKLRSIAKSSVSRAQLLKGAGVGLAAAALPGVAAAAASPGASPSGPTGTLQFPFFPQVGPGQTYQTEQARDIFNVAVTAEYLAVTVLTAALGNAATLFTTPVILATVQAALAEEYYHLVFLRDTVGATPGITTFTVPDPTILTNPVTFFRTIEVAENLFVAAYMAATREFAELGQPTLAKIAYQIGGTEAEHRVMARAALALLNDDHVPPNNKAFETDLLLYVRDVATALGQLGFVGGTGTSAAYPGDAAAKAAFAPVAGSIVQRMPNNATSSVTGTGNLTGSIETITTTLLGANEIPAGDPNARGTAMITLDAVRGQVSFTLTVTGLSSPATAAHIHKGPAGVEGPVVIPLSPPTSGTSSGTVSADPALIADIIANPANYYVNVHNAPYPGGAARGQLG